MLVSCLLVGTESSCTLPKASLELLAPFDSLFLKNLFPRDLYPDYLKEMEVHSSAAVGGVPGPRESKLQIIIITSFLFLGERRYGVGGDDSTPPEAGAAVCSPRRAVCQRVQPSAQPGSARCPSSLLGYKGSSTVVTCSENSEWPGTGLHRHCCCCHGA